MQRARPPRRTLPQPCDRGRVTLSACQARMPACLTGSCEGHLLLDRRGLWAPRVPDHSALHPDGKCRGDSLEPHMLQIGDPNPSPQGTWFSLSLNSFNWDMYSPAVTLSTFKMLSNHHHYLGPKHFHHLKKEPWMH